MEFVNGKSRSLNSHYPNLNRKIAKDAKDKGIRMVRVYIVDRVAVENKLGGGRRFLHKDGPA